MDKFPIGAIMNRDSTVRAEPAAARGRDRLDPVHLATHHVSLEDAPRGYEMFKYKQDGCVRAVFAP